MIVLHILAVILKITGIFLLCLLALILLLVLALLFSPVRYQAQAAKEKTFACSAGVSWLLHLFSVKIRYRGGQTEYSLRVLGIPVEKLLKYLEKRRRQKAEIQKKETKKEKGKAESGRLEKQGEAEKPELEQELDRVTATEQSQPEKQEGTATGKSAWDKVQETSEDTAPGFFSRAKAFFKGFCRIPGKIKKALENFGLTVQKICAKIKQIREILESDTFIRAKNLVWRETKRVLKHVLPKKVSGFIKFGTEDPCITGKLLAAAGIFFPLYGENLTIEPYFDQNILEGDIRIQGRIYGVIFLRTAWRLFCSPDIRFMIKKMKQQGGISYGIRK